jgi:uncharacterized integral membrane protein (TIGR00698 family)
MSFSLRKSFILLPGIEACSLISVLALLGVQAQAYYGRVWFEPLVLSILIGALIRVVWTPGSMFEPGISYSAKTLLEIAVALLGATISIGVIIEYGWLLVLGIAVFVPVAIGVSYGIGRMLGVAPRVSLLAACGNAICGNSAIAATAPVIGATAAEVASAIAFTALVGLATVLVLPLALSAMTATQYGVLAGLTVYAVPQVLAAAAPGGIAAVHMGTVTKLLRVLMLGPVILALSIGRMTPPFSLAKAVPWFISAFVILMGVNSIGLIPAHVSAWMGSASGYLAIAAMAGLGLQCDWRAVAKAGPRVSLTVILSLAALALMAYGLIRLLGIA